MRSIKLFFAVLFSLTVAACGGGGDSSPAPAPAPTSSEGAAGSPQLISTMPYNGYVGATYDSSYYTFTTTATTQTITLTNLTADVDVKVYTDAAFTTQSTNWTCSVNYGTTADSCTASTAAPAGTTLYIKAVNYATTTGATYTLEITTTSTPATGSEGAAGAPLTITMPHNGQVGNSLSSYYQYTATGTIQTITATNLTADIDPKVYTNATFTTQDPNWTCTASAGTSPDTCTANTPVPAGTVLYLKALNWASAASATFTLGVTTTTPPATTPVPEGSAGAPLTISMPYNGQVGSPDGVSINDSFYSYTTVGTVGTINLTNMTDGVEVLVYTDATFSTVSPNWTCSYNAGTTPESCTATGPVPAGTVLYINVWSMTLFGAGDTFTLSVAP